MKTLKTNPGAKRLMESLRNMGYDYSTAIADLVDNSVTAGASEIYIEINPKQFARADMIPKQEYRPASIIIADNGKGMSREELHEAMRFGTFQEYSSGDLGKFGLGLKTASLSQARVLTVFSKAKSGSGIRPRPHYMRWDLDHIYETDDWNLLIPEENELQPWEVQALNHDISKENGTVILLTNLEGQLSLLSSSDDREREKYLARVIDDVSKHLRMVFHRFMQGNVPGHRKLNIYICGTLLEPWDPFCRSEKTTELDILRIPVILTEEDSSKIEKLVTVSPYILPREEEFSSYAAWKDASGPKNWNQQQGLYFYRNNRLIQAGGWSYLRAIDEHTKLLRVAIDFPSELDRTFTINITKMRAGIPADIREEISNNVSTWIKLARTRYDNSSSTDKPSPSVDIPVKPGVTTPVPPINPTSTLRVTSTPASVQTKPTTDDDVNKALRIFYSDQENWTFEQFCKVLIDLLEKIYNKEITSDQIPMQEIKKIFEKKL